MCVTRLPAVSICLMSMVYFRVKKMFNNQWDEWDQWEVLEQDYRRAAVRRSRRIVPDRMNPFTAMRDTEFIARFRLRVRE